MRVGECETEILILLASYNCLLSVQDFGALLHHHRSLLNERSQEQHRKQKKLPKPPHSWKASYGLGINMMSDGLDYREHPGINIKRIGTGRFGNKRNRSHENGHEFSVICTRDGLIRLYSYS